MQHRKLQASLHQKQPSKSFYFVTPYPLSFNFLSLCGDRKNNNLIFQPDFFEQTFWDFRESFIHLGSIKTAPIQVLNCREFWSKHYYWKWFYLQWPNYAQFFSSRKQSVLHVIYFFKDHLDHFVFCLLLTTSPSNNLANSLYLFSQYLISSISLSF